MPVDVPEVSEYRFAPLVAARIVGALLVAVAVIVLLVTVLVAALGLSVVVVPAVAVLAVVGAAAAYAVLRRVPVVRLDPEGYRVRMVRGAGTDAAAWAEVDEAVTATPAGLPVVVLKLRDGRTTTVPVTLLAVDREQFVRELQAYLMRGHGLRPLS